MLKGFKKLVSLVLVLVVSMVVSVPAFAEENRYDDEVNGDMTISEGAKPYVQTKQDAIRSRLKLNSKANLLSGASAVLNVKMDVPVYTQKNGYYCGPATVKEVLQYCNGSSSTQETYAKELGTTSDGTDMTQIDDVLNDHQIHNDYLYEEFDDRDEWDTYVKYDMAFNFPTVIDINSKGLDWKYSTTGHYMCISGYDNSGSTTYIYVADPHNKYAGTYKYTADQVYNVNNNHWRHAVVW